MKLSNQKKYMISNNLNIVNTNLHISYVCIEKYCVIEIKIHN